ncbi:MAG: ATP-binding protein [Chlamydiales bacterium]|nr:ATP-binding protein [Chlamydiales bacterium]
MRIAISGTHFSGKSTLIATLLKQFPNFTSVEEPYILLEEQGYEFSNPPSVEDFEQQLEFSVTTIIESRNNIFFDRCPLDCLAYALALGEVDVDSWIQKMDGAIQLLDLIVFLPIEDQDRIAIPVSEDLKLRKRVDENLQDILLNDSLGILKDVEILEVVGSVEKRVRMVKAKLDSL